MDKKFDEVNAVEAYEKPSMQIYEMEVENALMKGSSEIKPGWGPDKGDNGSGDGHGAPPGLQKKENSRSYLPERNTKPYMGSSDE